MVSVSHHPKNLGGKTKKKKKLLLSGNSHNVMEAVFKTARYWSISLARRIKFIPSHFV
jgi:hypothetical protein